MKERIETIQDSAAKVNAWMQQHGHMIGMTQRHKDVIGCVHSQAQAHVASMNLSSGSSMSPS